MGSRDKDSKSLQDKLKNYFRKGSAAPLPPRAELLVSAELERDLGADSPLPRRLKLLKEIGDKVLTTKLQAGGAERLWGCARDLLEAEGAESRGAALAFARCLAAALSDGQLMRTVLFRYLRDSHARRPPQDHVSRFRLLQALTRDGKDITCFEEQLGVFLLEWLPQIENPAHVPDFLQLVTNVVKFNATYLDEDVVHGIVDNACMLCLVAASGGTVLASLALLEAVVSYSLLPRAALPAFVHALCRTVNTEHYCQNSWKVMRYVLGADLGHAALQEMAELLAAGGDDAGLLRGAVFYMNMALWGSRRVPTLRVSYLAVLPAFLQALAAGHPVVTYEVVLALQNLCARCAAELHEPAWELVVQLLAAAHAQNAAAEPPNDLIRSHLHDVISQLEALLEARQYTGDPERLLELVAACARERPESSALRLVSAQLAALGPSRAGWTAAAARLADAHVRHDPRPAVKLHALHELHYFVQRHRHLYEDELLERVAIPTLSWAASAGAGALRAAAARQAAELALHCAGDRVVDLVEVLDKILNRAPEGEGEAGAGADEAGELRAALGGLLEVFRARLCRAGPGAARALQAAVEHLELQYRRAPPGPPELRLQVFELLFALRVNAAGCVGLAGEGGAAPVFSPYLVLEGAAGRAAGAGGAGGAVCGARVLRLCVLCVQRETAWRVAERVLRALPPPLPAPPAAPPYAPDLDALAAALVAAISEKGGLRGGTGGGAGGAAGAGGVAGAELAAAALAALGALAPHHARLEPATQQRVVRCLLKYGIVLRQPSSAACVSALSLWALEARDTAVRMLPEVLLELSKISDTKLSAQPVLEFLSTLTRLPKVFASFVEDQYMSVFAILLPYTNPSRYNHYVVSLAHHVVAAWFLHCRLAYRRNFVRFIIHGLHNYIIMPFEEQLFKNNFQQPPGNEDSSHRKRSSSLGSKGANRAPLGSAGGAGGSAAFHVELTEACVDLLARYTFSPCSVRPARSAAADFLFAGGSSVTWLVGHKLVTITTSGCQQNPLKAGLCDRCAALCRQQASRAPSPPPPPPDEPPPPDANQLQVQLEVRRYSKHSLQRSRSGDTSCSELSSTELLPPSEPASRQNSSDYSRGGEAEARLEEAEWWRGGGGGGAGAGGGGAGAGGGCPCWCARWAEVLVRAPSGDVSWAMRLQNALAGEALTEHALHDVHALLAPSLALHDALSDWGRRDTSPPPPPPDRSSSDSAVSPRAAPAPPAAPARAHASTSPINIPGSPQRRSPADLEGKSRLPVRRSNSSPEMSSSWKLVAREAPPAPASPPPAPAPSEMILLPSCEPTTGTLHPCKKGGKKSELRGVSCEAIPEEMSGTSPHAPPAPPPAPPAPPPAPPAPHAPHPPLHTYSSDPGAGAVEEGAGAAGEAPRLALVKTASDGSVQRRAGAGAGRDKEELPPLSRSKRSNTISVMSPTRRRREAVSPRGAPRSGSSSGVSSASGGGGAGGAGGAGGGVAPAFVLLQLYQNMPAGAPLPTHCAGSAAGAAAAPERPLRVLGAQHERTVKNLDLVPPIDTYKVGVLYVAAAQQDSEVAILRNEHGSPRYEDFLQRLGALVELTGAAGAGDEQLFLNVERGGQDGRYTYVWSDDVMQVQFHVATAMPTLARDPACNEKRKYIGNDPVSIVYNESGAEFHITTIKGQLNLCIVLVEPLAGGLARVRLKTKDERVRTKFLAHVEPALVSDRAAPLLARQLALHAALAAHISQSLSLSNARPYASNCLERLRIIKRLRARLEAEQAQAAGEAAPYARPDLARSLAIDDFTHYT